MDIKQKAKNFDGTIIEIRFGVWRCAICGEIFYGVDRPSHCPYCGSDGPRNMVHPSTVKEDRDVIRDLTQQDADNLTRSISMELGDSKYYTTMSKRSDTGSDDLRAMFARLAKVEAEHCELFCRLLNVTVPSDLEAVVPIMSTWKADIIESSYRERGAVEMYGHFATMTNNPRLKQVWTELSHVELEHYTFEHTQLDSDRFHN